MGKLAPNEMIDASLNYVGDGNYMSVCSGTPTTYTLAYTTNKLAGVAMAAGDFAVADDTSGRKLTMSAKTGVSITSSDTATHVCIVNTTDSTLRYVTTCTSQALVSGGTVDIPAFKINIADPT